MNRDMPITSLRGVGEKTGNVFAKAGIRTLGDLLSYYPRTYRKYENIIAISEWKEGQNAAVYAVLERELVVQYIRRLQMVSGILLDKSGRISVRWYNMPYLRNTLKKGTPYVFYGKIVKKGNQVLLEQPAVFSLEQYEEMQEHLQPVYVLTKGLSSQMIAKLMHQTLEAVKIPADPFGEEIRKRYQLAEYAYSVEEIHFPRNEHHLKLARNRLVFDEFFYFIYALRCYKQGREKEKNSILLQKRDLPKQIMEQLPYELTHAQKRVWEEIQADLTGEHLMARLVQGDVGSGKTILAFLAMLFMADNGWQSSIMVPTEVLARQHFEAFQELLQEQNLPFQVELLTGSMTAKEKREAYSRIASGEANVIIGTHALIQEKVSYKNLALVITDEQHRFGVRQRESFGEKGQHPHELVMSATPIPRTLAVILYGDLEISVVDELPSNRVPIKNCVVTTAYRQKAYQFMENQIQQGHQVYIICPMVEENEQIEAEDVLSYTERLRERFPADICVEYLHGKMKPKEKNEIMERFVRNEIQILVSTTVVEVGVNVPNATVMMIEDAQRFGLAQLHQLRGRVGRGKYQSYCIMISTAQGEKIPKRLEILNKSNDGFYIASEDLKLRGPGDLLGVRQSGMMEFKIGDVFSDAKILSQACEAVDFLQKEDPYLEWPEHTQLKKEIENYMINDLKKLNL